MKKVFIVRRTDEIGSDEYAGVVILATSARDALKLAKELEWGVLYPEFRVDQVNLKTSNSRILFTSFNAG